MRFRTTSRSGAVALAMIAGCAEPTGGGGGGGNSRIAYKDIPILVNRDVDVLFVIDDTSSLEIQQNLKNNFPSFINVLNLVEGGLPNLHLGVVTSDLGTRGAEDAVPGPSIGSGFGSCAGDGKSGNLTTNGTTLVAGKYI